MVLTKVQQLTKELETSRSTVTISKSSLQEQLALARATNEKLQSQVDTHSNTNKETETKIASLKAQIPGAQETAKIRQETTPKV